MKAIALPIVAAALALAGCAKSDKAGDAASADNVEMPAEEAMSGVTATPSADPSALASEAADQAESAADQAGSAAETAGSAAGAAVKSGVKAAGDAAKKGVDAATSAADQKM